MNIDAYLIGKIDRQLGKHGAPCINSEIMRIISSNGSKTIEICTSYIAGWTHEMLDEI